MSESAFLKAYEAHADAIYRHCFFRVRSKEAAEDLTQETYLRAWRYAAAGEEIRNLRALLYRIANNLVIDHARRKRETRDLDGLAEQGREPGEDTRERLIGRLDGERAVAALERLDEAHRTVLMMRYIDGLKPKEIAEVLGETHNAVSVRIHRAKQRAKSLLI